MTVNFQGRQPIDRIGGIVSSSSLAELIADALRRAGDSRAELGKAMGLSRQRIALILQGESPGIEACLRLAQAQDRDPATVLRAAGHVGVADLLAALYGAQGERTTATDRRWRRLRDTLSPADVAAVESVLVRLAGKARPKSSPSRE